MTVVLRLPWFKNSQKPGKSGKNGIKTQENCGNPVFFR
jgi:hypothetical protein